MEPMAILLGMIVPRAIVSLEIFPLIPACDILPISPVDALWIEVSKIDHPAKLTREDDIRIEMQDPVPGRDLIKSPPNHPALVEDCRSLVWFVVRVSIAKILIAHHELDILLPADRVSFRVVWTGHNDNMIKIRQILPQGFSEEISIANANGDCLNTHVRYGLTPLGSGTI